MAAKIDPKKVGDLLVTLAELLTIDGEEMTAKELIDSMEGFVMTRSEARDVRMCLSQMVSHE